MAVNLWDGLGIINGVVERAEVLGRHLDIWKCDGEVAAIEESHRIHDIEVDKCCGVIFGGWEKMEKYFL